MPVVIHSFTYCLLGLWSVLVILTCRFYDHWYEPHLVYEFTVKSHVSFSRFYIKIPSYRDSLSLIYVLIYVQISILVAKYWLRVKDSLYEGELVGKAARLCIQSNFQGVKFTDYLLEMCNLKPLKDLVITSTSNIRLLAKYLKSELYKQYNITWRDQIQQCSKLRTLNLVKPRIGFENYLSRISNVKHRQAVTRLRISAHKFPVESGRYANIDYDSRVCTICNLNEVGDELHYFSNCNNSKLVTARDNFLSNLLEVNSSFSSFGYRDLFMYCVSMTDDSIVKITAKYLYDITTIFNDCTCCD